MGQFNLKSAKRALFKEIKEKSLIFSNEVVKIADLEGRNAKWIFDLRPLLLRSESLSTVAEIFWHTYENEYPFQVGCQETAAIPLLGAIAEKGMQRGKPITTFVIRKSRKKTGLQKNVEGEVSAKPIILIDDTINTGSTISRQLDVLANYTSHVNSIFCLVRFRDVTFYDFIKRRNIKMTNLFSLEDFGLTIEKKIAPINRAVFKMVWKFDRMTPNFSHVVPKAGPTIDNSSVYFGTDAGYVYSLDQHSGEERWRFKISGTPTGKIIFSTPAIHREHIYFGAYDGNFYAVNKSRGSLQWYFDEADWIGSSPAISTELNLVFIGLEFGLFKKKGGIAALDLMTGEKKWGASFSKEYVHASPLYIPEKQMVGIGSNDHSYYMFEAASGKQLWSYKTNGEIKGGAVYDQESNTVFFGSFDGAMYGLDANTGTLKNKYQTENIIYSTPLIEKERIYLSSGDKRLYCFDLKNRTRLWDYLTGGRILASPRIINQYVYVGSNDGNLYQIDKNIGRLCGVFPTIERITNPIAYNPLNNTYFVLTDANELYALKLTGDSKS